MNSMVLREILQKDSICVDLKSTDKEGVLKELVSFLPKGMRGKQKLFDILIERENLGSTGIGQGIAVPHGKSTDVSELKAAFGLSKAGVDFKSLDGEPVHIFFLLIAPKESPGPHLKALARISKILRDSSFCDILRKAEDSEKVFNLIVKEDERNQ